MVSLSDKLKSLGVQHGARHIQPRRPSSDYPIEMVVNGQLQSTSHGNYFLSETRLPDDHRHGRVGLRPEAAMDPIANWLEDTNVAIQPLEQFIFLDTETSGLAGGTGTYAFLVGAARFDQGQFRLVQFFMPNPGEEKALLQALTEFIDSGKILVTFNGKSFDAPLLNTRYTMHGWESPLPDLTHLDLLPLARRLWRDRLPSRRLTDLERDILLLTRTEEDVPGWLIPQIYFDYVRSGDARPLKGVFYHNKLDVVAMAALLNQITQMLADPLSESVEYALDLVAIGKLYEAMGELDQAARLFYEGMQRDDLPEEHYWTTQHRLSFLEKRRGNWVEAVNVWELAAQGRQLYAHVELAKFYEHKQQDYSSAMYWTDAALELILKSHRHRSHHRQWLADLKHRQARLQRKLENQG